MVIHPTEPSGRLTRDVHFTPAPPADQQRGLLGWVRFSLAGLLIDAVAVRITRSNRLTLSFPVRHDSSGRQHPVVRPQDADARYRIEREVLQALEDDLRRLDQPGGPAGTDQNHVSQPRHRRSSR